MGILISRVNYLLSAKLIVCAQSSLAMTALTDHESAYSDFLLESRLRSDCSIASFAFKIIYSFLSIKRKLFDARFAFRSF